MIIGKRSREKLNKLEKDVQELTVKLADAEEELSEKGYQLISRMYEITNYLPTQPGFNQAAKDFLERSKESGGEDKDIDGEE